MISLEKSTLPVAGDPERARRLREEWLTSTQKVEGLRQRAETALGADHTATLLDGIFGNSPYLSDLLFAHPETFLDFLSLGPQDTLQPILDNLNAATSDTTQHAMALLREAKAKVALTIALGDISNIWGLDSVTHALSDFAEAAVSHTVRTLLRQGHEAGHLSLKNPNAPEEGSGYSVLALGKLGSRELNYSSDIDLFVFFDDDVMPYVGKKSPHEFAISLTKDLVRILHERNAAGYVFRTDLRLRPDPGSTAIAVSRDAAQIYYESYGQNWERAAFIKARPVAGDIAVAKSFLKELQPFIWRKSLDFYAIQDIHSIKRQIYAHKGGSSVEVAGHNIKLGRGGIREIEFFAQIQQLIWGGRFPEARVPQTIAALKTLAQLEFVSETATAQLTEAYTFLRTLEHRLQMMADEQTQTLPSDPDKLRILAAFLGYQSLEPFKERVTEVLRSVEKQYAKLFEDSPSLTVEGNLVFTGTEDDPGTIETLERLGYKNASTVIQMVRTWHHGRYRSTRSDRARQLLTELMPGIISAFAKTSQPDTALIRFDRCLSSLHAGVPIFSVFYANPQLLELVGEIMGDAPRLAEHLSRYPALLDYVLEPEFYTPVEGVDNLTQDLQTTLQAADAFEHVLDMCRRWTNDQKFRIGVQCLKNIIDPIEAAIHLSEVAEAVIQSLVPLVAEEFKRQFGTIPGGSYALVAYGKLGSRELTPTSDLDLVAVYDADMEAYSEGGPKSLPSSAYYIRLTQRVVTAFTSLTQEGVLYELDLRLRPSGDTGPLACSLTAFTKYQMEDAWTWEHMALTRARVVFGPADLTQSLRNVISKVLTRARNPDELVRAVAEMRNRMRRDQKVAGEWDVKRRPGGLIDAEFTLQYLMLRHPKSCDPDASPAEVIDQLAAASHLDKKDAQTLKDAIAFWSRIQFMIRLTTEGNLDAETLNSGLGKRLTTAAGVKDFADLEKSVKAVSDSVSEVFQRVIEIPAERQNQAAENQTSN